MVNGVNLEITTVPSDTDTTLEVSAKLSSDNDTAVEGLVLADFLLTQDGVTDTITNVAENSAGNYTLTMTTAATTGMVIFVDLFDSSGNNDVVDSGNVLYRSDDGATETTVA